MSICTGLWHPNLEARLIEDVRRIKTSDPLRPVVILIGSRLLGDYLQWRLIESRLEFINVRFLTFSDLVDALSFKDRIKDKRDGFPPGAESECVAAALESLGEGHYFEPIAERQGFRRLLTASFKDLDEADIESLDVPADAIRSHGRIEVLKRIRDTYQAETGRFRSRIEDYRNAWGDADTFPRVFGTEELHVYGIYDFIYLQARLLKALSGVIKLRIYLPYIESEDDFGNAFSYVNPVKEWLVGKVSDVSMPEPEKSSGFGSRLFRYNLTSDREGWKPDGLMFSAFSATDPASEVDEIAGRISEMVLYEGVAPDRIGVMLWQPQDYLDRLRKRLAKSGIPCCDSIGTPLAETPAGKMLLALLELDKSLKERREIIDLASRFELKFAELCGDEDYDVVTWEKLSVEAGIIDGDSNAWLRALDSLKDRLTTRTEEWKTSRTRLRQLSLFRNFISNLFNALSFLIHATKWSEFCEGALRLTEEVIPDCTERDKVYRIVNDLKDYGKVSEQTDASGFIRKVEEHLVSVKEGKGKYKVDGVTLCDRMTARGVSFDTLFIPGLIQGSVPAAVRDDPVLSDSDRLRINKFLPEDGEIRLRPKQDRVHEEKLLFALAVDSAITNLVLSCPEQDGAGNALLPSRFLLEMLEVTTGETFNAEDFAEYARVNNPRYLPTTMKRLNDSEQYAIQYIRSTTPHSKQAGAFRVLFTDDNPRFARKFELLENRIKGPEFSDTEGMMPGNWISPAGESPGFAVTGLETYASCPFKYYLGRILRLDAFNEPERYTEPPPAAQGSLIHSVLEKLFIAAKEEDEPPPKSTNIDWYIKRLCELIADTAPVIKAQYPAPEVIWDLTLNSIRRRLEGFLKHISKEESLTEFLAAEVPISGDLVLEDDQGSFTLKVRGKIDRVDVITGKDGLAIIDYKTGSRKPVAGKLKGGKNLQLPIYLKFLVDRHSDKELEHSFAEYVFIDPRGIPTRPGLNGEDLIRQIPDLRKIVETLVEHIERGVFPPLPFNRKECDTCDFSRICDHRSRKSAEWKQTDENLAKLLSIREID